MKKNCYNCKHRSDTFKVVGLTHVHCFNPVEYPDHQEVDPWETLREFWDSCPRFEKREKEKVEEKDERS